MQENWSRLYRLLKACGLWPVCSAAFFLLLAIRGDSFAAILIAASGITALPMISGTFRRYGITASQQFKACLATAGASCAMIIVFPTGSPADTSSVEVALAKEEPPSELDAPSQLYDPGAQASESLERLYSCVATDGDTRLCNGERIRLLGRDAPEMPGHCRDSRQCAPGDPFASQANLQRNLSASLYIERVKLDHYGRTVALVSGSNGNLSCIQLTEGHAIYVRDWDDGYRVANECGIVSDYP